MAGLSQLLPLLRVIYFFSKLCGFRNFYYHAPQQTFKLMTRHDNCCGLFYSRLMYIINLVGIPAFILLRLSVEYKNEYMNSIQSGSYPPPNFPGAITDAAYAVAYFLNCIVFRHNQQHFVVLGNNLLIIYRALQTRKMQPRFSSILLLLSYFLFIIIIGTFANNIMNIWKTLKRLQRLRMTALDDESYIWLLKLFLSWTNLLYDLHLLLLVLVFVLITSCYRQLSDLLLKTSKKSVKRSEKLMRILPLLQTVQQQATRYFSFFLTLLMIQLLHAVHCLVNTFKYDDATLHPLLEDFEDLELDQKLYHAPIAQRSSEVRSKMSVFLKQMATLLLELQALSVCKREHENLLDIITFPIDAPYIQTIDQSHQLDVLPDAIIVCNDAEPQRNLFDIMLGTEKPLGSLSLEDTFGLHFRDFKIPLKMLKQSVHQICCSTFVLTAFDKLQQLNIKKLEQKYK